jgi:uncharacterized damage-inducible protein DinB
MSDRRTPFLHAGEREMLVAFLDYLRESVEAKAAGLAEADARRPMVPSGTSVLGLVKHLTMVEVAWFHWAFAGLDVAVPPGDLADDDTAASVLACYRAARERSNELVAGCDDLDRLCARQSLAPEPMSLRWVLVHMVEETGRHAGHADIVRELIDGTVGR